MTVQEKQTVIFFHPPHGKKMTVCFFHASSAALTAGPAAVMFQMGSSGIPEFLGIPSGLGIVRSARFRP